MQKISRHQTDSGIRWALNDHYLPPKFSLTDLLALPRSTLFTHLTSLPLGEAASAPLLAPIEPIQEVWACGVTYLRSRDARKAESQSADVYDRVYDAARPEVFFKSLGWRAIGHEQPVRIRRDSNWNVPEPELTLVVNGHGEIVGFCAGNDMSSRSIEGENPLYLPQAKSYDGSCAIGPVLQLADTLGLDDMRVAVEILRSSPSAGSGSGDIVYSAETSSSQMKRGAQELVDWLMRELSFPNGVFLMTGTALVPDESFTLQVNDVVNVHIGDLTLTNPVH